MSVISRNPFDLLGDDGETPKPAAAPKPTTSTPAAAPKAREVPGSKPPTSGNKGGDNATRGKSGYYSRGGPRNVLKNNVKPAGEGEVTVVDPEEGYEGERRAPGKNERGQARPRGHGEGSGRGRATRSRGRGGATSGGPAGYQGAGERRNDGRRSAHALPDTEKRVASGWGADDGEAELTAEVEGAVDATKEAAEPQTPAAEDAPAVEAEAEKKPEEEEDNSKTYEEYLKERQAAKDAKLGKLEGRAVDGTSEFVGSVFQKQEEEFFSGAKKEKAAAAKKEKERKEKVFIEVEGKFAPPSRGDREGAAGRGGRGGRGGFRGDRGSDRPRGSTRGGRGGARNNASSGAAPVAVNDESAFPALGA